MYRAGSIIANLLRKEILPQGPLQIEISHEHCNYPEATCKGTESNPKIHKVCSISIPVPSPPHTNKGILSPEIVFTRQIASEQSLNEIFPFS